MRDTCALDLQWTRLDRNHYEYSAAWMMAYLQGWDPATNATIPQGARTTAMCALKGRTTACRQTLVRHAGATQYAVLAAEAVYTQVGLAFS